MKVLITGIHGFVGNNLVSYLAPGNEIYGLDIVAPDKEGVVKTFSWEDLDAGRVPEVYFKVNTGLTQKIYVYFLKSSASKFVFFSTVKAAAERVEGVLTEDVVPAPVGPYGESKIKAEEHIQAHPAEGKSVYILRPCMIHGPGNKGNLNLLYSVVRKGIPWPLGGRSTIDGLSRPWRTSASR